MTDRNAHNYCQHGGPPIDSKQWDCELCKMTNPSYYKFAKLLQMGYDESDARDRIDRK